MRKILGVAAGIAAACLPLAAFAQYSTTTAASDVVTMANSTGQGISGTTGVILAIGAGLAALGWGWRKFHRHVSGRAF